MASEMLSELALLRKSVELLVQLKVEEMRGDRKQVDLIHWLDGLGCKPVEIAKFLNTTPNNVSPVLSRGRKNGKAKPKRHENGR